MSADQRAELDAWRAYYRGDEPPAASGPARPKPGPPPASAGSDVRSERPETTDEALRLGLQARTEVERLREERDTHAQAAEEWHLALGRTETEVKRLREALRKIRDGTFDGQHGEWWYRLAVGALSDSPPSDITADRQENP